MSKNKEIKKAQEEYEYLTGDEEERRIAFLREKALRDENSIFDAGKDIGRKEGKEEGKEEGKKEEKKEIAKSMLKEKMPIETIIKITKLSTKEIEKIEKEM